MSDQQKTLGEEQEQIKTILVVEDDVDIGMFFVQAVKEATPYQVFLASDGFQALNIVRDFKPDLFIFDYRLPGMNGIELYHQLHTIEGLEAIPVLFVSANLPPEVLEKRYIHLIRKPFELDELLEAIHQLLAE